MDTSNWRPTPPTGEPTTDAGDWRSQLPPESRHRIVNKIMETLKRRLPFSGHEGINELKKIAIRFEEKIFSAASSQSDYLRRISLKMLTLESNVTTNPPDPGSKTMQHQVHNQAQSLPIQLPGNQTQASQQLLSHNILNNRTTTGAQSSSGLPSTLPSVPGINQNPVPSGGGLNTSMQNLSGVSQNMVGSQTGQGMPANMFANQQRQMQMQGRPQVLPQQQQQQQQQSQNLIYQQQLLRQKFQQGNMQHSLMQSQMQQQQQQNLLQPTQLHSAQQSGMQSSSVQPPSMQSSLPGITQSQQSSVQQSTQSMLHQQQQSVLRQQAQPQQSAGVHQQQAPMTQQSLMSQQKQPPPSQQQQQLLGQQANASNLQQNQLIGQQNNLGDMQQQQQQRLLGQQNNLPNLQQQQQLMAQQNNLSNMHQQQLGSQSNVSGMQQPQQQLLGTQPVSSSMQTNQHSLHMLQSKVPVQQTHQAAPNVLGTQGQASDAQHAQQQMMPQMQSQPTQLQQQLGMQQQSNLLQRDMQQRLQTSGQASSSLLQSQNLMDQQKQLYQAQRAVPDTSSTSLDSAAQTANANGGDWQEEIYQKIRSMKETYFLELSEMYHKINSKLTQHENIPQAAKPEQFEKLKFFKLMLERMINFLNVSKNSIIPAFKDKLVQYEKQIISFMNTNRPRKTSLQQGQLPQSHMHPMQQQQSQITQGQSHDSQMNSQVQSMNLQSTMPIMQQSSITNLQHNSMSSLPGASTAQQQMLGQLQQSSNVDSGQGNAIGSLPQVVPGSLHNAVSAPQQANVNTLPSQMSSIQSNNTTLQNQHLKQQQEQQILQAQHLKQQIQQRQMQQYMQKQQLIQQQQQPQQQQVKQQLHAQLQTQQIPQLHQMNEANDMKMRQGMGVKPGVYQHHPTSQRAGYAHSQLKPAAQFPSSSSQLLPAASPQMHQNSSPQVEQQNVLSSITKVGTPLQSANSPFIVTSPSPPMAPSPMHGDNEKPIPGASSLPSVSNIGHQQTTATQAGSQSLAIGTPGISASPLLAEFTVADGTLANTLATVSGKSNITEQPLERLIKAVKSMSSKALTASVSDIGSVVSMIDRIAGSAPGNGSRAAVGEDLVAMTKCRLQAKNFITQDGMTGSKKMRRYTSAVPLNVVSSAGSGNDSFMQLTVSETSDLESTATSSFKRPRLKANHALLEEIREINQRLIDTVVDISDEDVDQKVAAAAAEGNEGTIVKCSFSAIALSPNLKSQYASMHVSPIQPLRLLVPTNYPNCSPILLDNFPVEVGKEHEDLSVKAKSRFSSSLRSLSQPMSLEEIARTWDICARAVISEYAQLSGGGSFSSKYGTWENCMTAA